MVLFNYSAKDITAKIVYYGPALGGKTSSLEYIYKGLPAKVKGKMLSLSTQTDRTLFFDFLPMELGKIYGWRVRVQLYTVPGQVFYDATRKIVLKGADGVVFVVDSQNEMLNTNIESWQNFQDNLKANNIDFSTIPLIIQYNKRDLKNIIPIAELEKHINTRNVPYFDTIATDGNGVLDALKAITKLVLQHLQKQYNKVLQEDKKEASTQQTVPVPEKVTVPQKEPETVPQKMTPPAQKAPTPEPIIKTPPKDIKKPVEEIIKPKEKVQNMIPEDNPTERVEVDQYEEIADEDIVELPVKDEELNLDADSWQQIEIGRVPESATDQSFKTESEEIPEFQDQDVIGQDIEELEELQIVQETDEMSFDAPPPTSAPKLSDTWKTSKSKIISEPKLKPPKESKDKTVEITAPLSKEELKLIDISTSLPVQQTSLPAEIKIDTEKGIMTITFKISIQLKKD